MVGKVVEEGIVVMIVNTAFKTKREIKNNKKNFGANIREENKH
jgi:hypothetical protein